MAFHVDVTDSALADAEDHVRRIRDVNKEPDAAERWSRGLVTAIYSLEEFPSGCPIIPEASAFNEKIRHLIYFSHRIIFGIDYNGKRVVVYRIFHLRKGLRPKDVRG